MSKIGHIIIEGTINAETGFATSPSGFKEKSKATTTDISTLPRMGGFLHIPGACIRGVLRGIGRDIVRDVAAQVTKNSKPFSLAEHFQLGKGYYDPKLANKGSASNETIEQLYINNPVLSLFGIFSPYSVPGRLIVTPAMADKEVEPVRVISARGDDLAQRPELSGTLSLSEYEVYLAMRDKGRAKTQIRNLESKIRKSSGEIKQALVKQKEKLQEAEKVKPTDVGISQTFGYDIIPPHTCMEQKFILRDVLIMSEVDVMAQLGFFVQILDTFARFPMLGAHAAVGIGQVSAKWKVKTCADTLGTLEIKPFVGLDVTGKFIADSVYEWEHMKAENKVQWGIQ